MRSHAIVIGASIGGLCAAEALASHFERVTLLERDRLPDGPALRRGVPQGLQPHGLQARGCREFEALFPGLLAACRAEGAHEFDPCLEVARLVPRGWVPCFANVRARALAVSRPLLEWKMRGLLLKNRPNVQLFDATRVTDLTHHKNGENVWVTGVRMEREGATSQTLKADLVVDSTGRGTKAVKWMAAVGLPQPEERRVDAKTNYATRHYRAPAEAERWWWRLLLVQDEMPHFARSCLIFRVEQGRWIVTAIGTNGDYAPTDEAGWLAYLKSARSTAVHDLVQRATPLSPIVQSRTTSNRWKRMHVYRGHLHGLLLFGDAVCSFNPSYGQGLTASALTARCFSDALATHAGPLDQRFLRGYYTKQAEFLREGWAFSTFNDFFWPNTEGKRPPFLTPPVLDRATLRAVSFLEQITVTDPVLLEAFWPLADFGGSPWSTLSPEVLRRLAWGLLRGIVAQPSLAKDIDLFATRPPVTERIEFVARRGLRGDIAT